MSSARKPRYALFSVGKNKASPARTASIKRASLRASVIRTEAPKLHLAFGDAEEADASGSKPPANAAQRLTTRDTPLIRRDSSPDGMKDAPLPSLPDDPLAARKPTQLAFHPPPETRPPRPPPTSRMPPPARQPGPSRPSATMPQPRPPPPQASFFRRLTSKIRSSTSPTQTQTQTQTKPPPDAPQPQRKVTIIRMPALPKAPPPAPLPNDFTSAEQRQAALRARGLIPASSTARRRFRDAEGFMMPLSEQEAEIDKRYTVVVPRTSSSLEDEGEDAGASEARKIREAWLAKQLAAGGVSSSGSTDEFADADASTSASGHESRASAGDSASGDRPPRTSDAAARASKDGTVGEKSPARATFVRAATLSPNVGEITIGGGSLSPSPPHSGSPLEVPVEDFHTAPNTPSKTEDASSLGARQSSQSASADRPRAASPHAGPARVPPNSTSAAAAAGQTQTHAQEPSTPSSHSSAVTEKVSRWLRTSSDAPASSSTPDASQAFTSTGTGTSPLSESPKQSSDETQTQTPTPTPVASTPTGTVRTRKEKPPPIIVTAHRSSSSPDSHSQTKASRAPQVFALAVAAPSDSELELDASTSSEGRPSLSVDSHSHPSRAPEHEPRGRGLHVSTDAASASASAASPPRLAHDVSSSSAGTTATGQSSSSSGTATSGSGSGTTSGRSRTNTVPALSPTRTVSSSGASSTLPTPTTMSCAPTRDASISRGSTSHSSDGGHGGHEHVRVRRAMTAGEMGMHPKAKTPVSVSRAGGVIMEEYSETEPSSEGGEAEFGVQAASGALPPPRQSNSTSTSTSQDGGPRPRPSLSGSGSGSSGRVQVLEAQTKASNRKSFSLFGKKSLDSQLPRETRTSSSMLNLRRAFTSQKPRPKSTLELSPVAEHGQGQGPKPGQGLGFAGMGRKKSKMFDASHLPASPTYAQAPPPPTAFSQGTGLRYQHHHASSSVSSEGRTTGVGLRPRQPVAPTMHSRGSILHQAHFIEDEESRRLSEMAFLT